MLDFVGIDTASYITDYGAKVNGRPQLVTNAASLKGHLGRGRAGVKTGKGSYDYTR